MFTSFEIVMFIKFIWIERTEEFSDIENPPMTYICHLYLVETLK